MMKEYNWGLIERKKEVVVKCLLIENLMQWYYVRKEAWQLQ